MYELRPNADALRRAELTDHPWAVIDIHAIPDGSFLVHGVQGPRLRGHSIVAYAGLTGERLWTLPFPASEGLVGSGVDGAGTVLSYLTPSKSVFLRPLPFRGQPDVPARDDEEPALGVQIVYRKVDQMRNGLRLAVRNAPSPFLTLSPDEPAGEFCKLMSATGRFVMWGAEDGTVYVCDLERVRAQLADIGLGW